MLKSRPVFLLTCCLFLWDFKSEVLMQPEILGSGNWLMGRVPHGCDKIYGIYFGSEVNFRVFLFEEF
jgi:hypothetical protein